MLNDFLSLLYPNNCICCKNALAKGEKEVCVICHSELPLTNYIKDSDNPVAKLFWGRVELVYGFATFHFEKKGKLQDLIHQLKYKDNTEVGLFLGKEIGKEIKGNFPKPCFDFVFPVPLHPKKERLRGYNQSDFIGKGIESITNIKFDNKNLVRRKNTDSQTRKSKFQRWENVSSIFEIVYPEKITGKHILIVDDVVTTGATLESCAQTILAIPNTKVSIAVAASGS